jgi:hypothetical protein
VDDEGLGEFVLGGKPTPRTQIGARLFAGLLGAALGFGGAVFVWMKYAGAGVPFRLACVSLLAAIGAFFLGNVALQRPWRWTLWWMALGLPVLFLVRAVFGA